CAAGWARRHVATGSRRTEAAHFAQAQTTAGRLPPARPGPPDLNYVGRSIAHARVDPNSPRKSGPPHIGGAPVSRAHRHELQITSVHSIERHDTTVIVRFPPQLLAHHL